MKIPGGERGMEIDSDELINRFGVSLKNSIRGSNTIRRNGKAKEERLWFSRRCACERLRLMEV